MNILHLKYAVEVEKTASITKAAVNLYMGQPHLSRCIKELEDSIGIKIFKRTAKGIIPTKQGSEFLEQAKSILVRIDNLELQYTEKNLSKVLFSVSVPRSEYISKAFARTISEFKNDKKIKINYKEVGTVGVIESILQGNYKLGIIRVEDEFYSGILATLESKDLKYEVLADFNSKLLIARNSVFTETVNDEDLENGIEIYYGDVYTNSITSERVSNENYNKIRVFERASVPNLLREIPNAYMWEFDMEEETVNLHNLKFARVNSEHRKHYRDILIASKTYKFSEHDLMFILNVRKYTEKLKLKDQI